MSFKISPNNGIFLNGLFNLKLLNNPLASCSLINLELLLLHNVHFVQNIVFPLVFFVILKFLLSSFCYTSSNMITLFYTKFTFQQITYFFYINSFKVFKTTVNTVIIKVNFSTYFAFHFNIIVFCKL